MPLSPSCPIGKHRADGGYEHVESGDDVFFRDQPRDRRDDEHPAEFAELQAEAHGGADPLHERAYII